MLVLDALFDHFQQISSIVEIIGSLVQRSPISAIDVGVGSTASVSQCPRRVGLSPNSGAKADVLARRIRANTYGPAARYKTDFQDRRT
jgi:hypothetical protein